MKVNSTNPRMSQPILASNLDLSQLTFVPGPTKAGRNPSINLKHGGSALNIRIKAWVPGGVITRENDNGVSHTLMPSMVGCDSYGVAPGPDTELGAFYNFLRGLKDKLVDEAVANSPKWFGKERSQVGISEGLNPILNLSCDKQSNGRYVPNGKYPPSFRVKVPVYDGRVTAEIIDSKKAGVYTTPDNLGSVFPKGVNVDMVISGSVYILAGGGFGLTWRLQKAQVFPPQRLTASDIFSEVADEDQEQEQLPSQVLDSQDDFSSPPSVLDQTVRPVAPPAPRKRRVPALASSGGGGGSLE